MKCIYFLLLCVPAMHAAQSPFEKLTHALVEPAKSFITAPVTTAVAASTSGALGYFYADRNKKNKLINIACAAVIGIGLSTFARAQYTLSTTGPNCPIASSVYTAVPGGLLWAAAGAAVMIALHFRRESIQSDQK